MPKIKILLVFGTRPEAIKLAPLIKALQQDSAFELQTCVTAQHRQMLDQVLSLFHIQPDFDLNIMQQDQDLTTLTTAILQALQPVFDEVRPNVVLVHGDTTSSFAAALAAFYRQIPVAHIEAGLRTGNLTSPFPEEANRRLTAVLSRWHFAPTEKAKQNLLAENCDVERIWVTGNTVIDTLLEVKKHLGQPEVIETLQARYPFLASDKKLILITGHRRENFGEPFRQICEAIADIAENPDVQIVYPVHLNPNVAQPVYERLGHLSNVFLLEPQDYLPFVYLMDKAYLILTDSGGIQEEAPALSKPVLVLRETTERVEAMESGAVKLIGVNRTDIVAEVRRLLYEPDYYQSRLPQTHPYGDGQAAQRIIQRLKQVLPDETV